jgi:hypothetical protein
MAMETDLRKANDIWTKHTPVKIYPVLASAVEATPQVGDDQQVNVDQVDDTPQVQEVQQVQDVQNDNTNQVENQVNTPNNSDQNTNTGANGAGAVVTPTEPIVGQETNTKEVAPPGNMSKDQMNPPVTEDIPENNTQNNNVNNNDANTNNVDDNAGGFI